jgi:hypothetical protein
MLNKESCFSPSFRCDFVNVNGVKTKTAFFLNKLKKQLQNKKDVIYYISNLAIKPKTNLKRERNVYLISQFTE